MQSHWYLALTLPLIIGSDLSFEEGQVRAADKQRENSREAPEAFQAKIGPKKRKIEADLWVGPHEPWEAAFYDGSPSLGFARGWIISRKEGYVSTTRRADMGAVKVERDRIILISREPANAWDSCPWNTSSCHGTVKSSLWNRTTSLPFVMT
jgi:hypothetical protein